MSILSNCIVQNIFSSWRISIISDLYSSFIDFSQSLVAEHRNTESWRCSYWIHYIILCWRYFFKDLNVMQQLYGLSLYYTGSVDCITIQAQGYPVKEKSYSFSQLHQLLNDFWFNFGWERNVSTVSYPFGYWLPHILSLATRPRSGLTTTWIDT